MIVLSRYLYSITDVQQSLLLSILEHTTEQALFWGYELYFSGFQEEAFDYLMDIAKYYFKYIFDCDQDNDMIHWVDYCKYVWDLSPNESHHHFGSCIATMCNHNHNLAPFVSRYFNIDIKKVDCLDENTYINMEPNEVDVYNEDYSKKTLYQILQHARKYAVNKTFDKLFKTYSPENEMKYILTIGYIMLVYHQYGRRVLFVGARIDERNKKIIFADEDLEEEFYEKWNYEPDEQSLATHQQAMGNPKEKQKDLETFCLQYGYQVQ